MTTASISYGTSTAMTLGLFTGPLATDANLIAGRESTAVDNTGALAIDYLVGGKVTTGTSPTASKQIEVWLTASYDGTTFGAGASGSDANFSPTGEKTQLKLLCVIPTDGTSNHTYEWGPFSVAQACGGLMPKKFGIFVVHNTGVSLNATAGNHEAKYTSVNYTSA